MNAQAPTVYANEPRWKEQFAEYVHAGATPFTAALRMWPHDTAFAYNISGQWKSDSYVLAHIEKLKAEAAAKRRPPSKEELIKDLRERAASMEDDDFIKAFRLIAEMSGHIAKPETTVQVNSGNTINRVMVVRDHGTTAEWQEKLQQQQAKLIDGAR